MPNIDSYRRTFSVALFFIGLILSGEAIGQEKSLRIVTINVWSGLDYVGSWRMGEYETAERREERFALLLSQIRKLNPDVVVLQEANPVGWFAGRLADSLSFDEIHQVCNAGIKFGPLGIPSNLKEGIAILARPSLNLKRHDTWKLSGGPGIIGDALSIHFGESIFALVGRIRINGVPLFIVDVHLVAAPPADSALGLAFDEVCREEGISERERGSAIEEWHSRTARQNGEAARLKKTLRELPAEIPVIVAGDFNAIEDSPAVQRFVERGEYFDTFERNAPLREYTWDPDANGNVLFSTRSTDARGDSLAPYDRLCALYDARPRKIDYVFLSDHFTKNNVVRSAVVIDSSSGGVHASDHFGVLTEVKMDDVAAKTEKEYSTVTPTRESTIEPLPIVSYDTDVGLGYGAMCFFLNQFRLNESFDCVLFNSTKGERWYRLVFSVPDFELRQGKTYPLALDLAIDYDKWIKNSFFGVGNRSKFDKREYYSREPLDINLTLSKAYSPLVVAQAGVRYKTVRNFNFTDTSTLVTLPPEANSSTATFESFFLDLRYDTRNSFINPSLGMAAQGELEQTVHTSFGDSHFTRLAFSFQYYSILFYPTTVLAVRLMGQDVIGNQLPVQVLSSVGGNNTVRGSPQDRFLDKVSAIANAEFRFPLIWRFGGVLGYDAGKVWNALSKVDVNRWAANPTAGLRLYMETFVVRFDVGFGHETTGFYFNFGQIF